MRSIIINGLCCGLMSSILSSKYNVPNIAAIIFSGLPVIIGYTNGLFDSEQK